MPVQQTDTIRLLPVGQPYNRKADPNKDQRFVNCFIETVLNPFSQTKRQKLRKRPGFVEHMIVVKSAFSYISAGDTLTFSGAATTALIVAGS